MDPDIAPHPVKLLAQHLSCGPAVHEDQCRLVGTDELAHPREPCCKVDRGEDLPRHVPVLWLWRRILHEVTHLLGCGRPHDRMTGAAEDEPGRRLGAPYGRRERDDLEVPRD